MKVRSKAQKAIIKRMQDGWKLRKQTIVHPTCSFEIEEYVVSIKALERKGLIVWEGEQYHLSPLVIAPAGKEQISYGK